MMEAPIIHNFEFQSSLFNDFNFGGSRKLPGGFSQINIFVGENNSGKSRLLRNLFYNLSCVRQNQKIDIYAPAILAEITAAFALQISRESNKIENIRGIYSDEISYDILSFLVDENIITTGNNSLVSIDKNSSKGRFVFNVFLHKIKMFTHNNRQLHYPNHRSAIENFVNALIDKINPDINLCECPICG